MKQLLIYSVAALAEIGGCFSFWAWIRMGKSALWLIPGMASLALFEWLLTLAAPKQRAAPMRLMAASTSSHRFCGYGRLKICGQIAGI